MKNKVRIAGFYLTFLAPLSVLAFESLWLMLGWLLGTVLALSCSENNWAKYRKLFWPAQVGLAIATPVVIFICMLLIVNQGD